MDGGDAMCEGGSSAPSSPMKSSIGGGEEPLEPMCLSTSTCEACEECETSAPVWACDVCEMRLCGMCFDVLHRKGRRAAHPRRALNGDAPPLSDEEEGPSPTNASKSLARKALSALFPSSSSSSAPSFAPTVPLGSSRPMSERAKYIPLRLAFEERRSLRLVEAALTVCDYTARVDQVFKTPAHREQRVLEQVTAVLEGLLLSEDYKAGRELLDERNYEEHEGFFQEMFEVARRYKVMNPEKMRGEYGKMLYLLQDAGTASIRRHLHLNLDGGIRTVSKLLGEKGGLRVLDDPLIHTATQEILPDPGKTRGQIQQEIKKKERAIEHLADKYESRSLSADEIRHCFYSICDNNSFLNSNRVPIDKMLRLLWEFFAPDRFDPGYSLAIVQGQDGARLTHSHERQFHFVNQSMTLWREITDDMFRLWMLAEGDLLSTDGPNAYELKDTGQGLHRLQQCPRTFYAMQDLLHKVQRRAGNWIGSSVIHLGDHNVPNALMFIDKYNQVPRILGPIVNTLEQVEKIAGEDDSVRRLIDRSFGGIHKCKKDILYDFFRYAFDGSGGDTFFDAGSCIDGRLTSAWNWCSQLSHKPFYAIFKLTGFTGFDGEFDR